MIRELFGIQVKDARAEVQFDVCGHDTTTTGVPLALPVRSSSTGKASGTRRMKFAKLLAHQSGLPSKDPSHVRRSVEFESS